MKPVVLASSNVGKLREMGALLQPLGFELVAPGSTPPVSRAKTRAITLTSRSCWPSCTACTRNSGRHAITVSSCLFAMPTTATPLLPTASGRARSHSSLAALRASATTPSSFPPACTAPRPNWRPNRRIRSATGPRRCSRWLRRCARRASRPSSEARLVVTCASCFAESVAASLE